MSNVPKSKHKESRFNVDHIFFKIEKAYTDLILHDFYLSDTKYNDNINAYKMKIWNCNNFEKRLDDYVTRYNNFLKWFINKERNNIDNILAETRKTFVIGNSIFVSNNTSKMIDYTQRRKCMNKTKGLLYVLKRELGYTAEVIPVDMNKYKPIIELIDTELKLVTGIIDYDNKFINKLNQ